MKIKIFIYYTALIIGFQAALFFSLFLISEAVLALMQGKTAVIPLLVMMVFSVAGFIYSVFAPHKGSIVMISGGSIMICYLLFVGGIEEIGMALSFGLPFILPGLIFLWIKDIKRRIPLV